MTTESDVLLVARPSAVQFAQALVLLRLPRWGLGDVADIIATLATALVRSVIDALTHSGQEHRADQLVFRCLLWSQHDYVGFGVEEIVGLTIPRPAVAMDYPAVQWGRTVNNVGKSTWFAMSLHQAIPLDPTAPPPGVNEITGRIPRIQG